MMRTWQQLVFAICVIRTCSVVACPENAPKEDANGRATVQYWLPPDGRSVTVPAGAVVGVELDSQAASTGYAWSLTTTSSAVELLSCTSVPNSSGLIGAPAKETWVLRVRETVPIVFALNRPWEAKETKPVALKHWLVRVVVP
jgi:predicted secreted protein